MALIRKTLFTSILTIIGATSAFSSEIVLKTNESCITRTGDTIFRCNQHNLPLCWYKQDKEFFGWGPLQRETDEVWVNYKRVFKFSEKKGKEKAYEALLKLAIANQCKVTNYHYAIVEHGDEIKRRETAAKLTPHDVCKESNPDDWSQAIDLHYLNIRQRNQEGQELRIPESKIEE